MKAQFDRIVGRLIQIQDVTLGKMMTSPALKYRNEVFLFFHNESMTFKLYDPKELEPFGIKEFTFLSPFKSKPPLKNWLIISPDYADQWESLSDHTLEIARGR